MKSFDFFFQLSSFAKFHMLSNISNNLRENFALEIQSVVYTQSDL